MNSTIPKKRWITGLIVSQCFHIKGRNIDKLRESLIGTEYIKRPVEKETKIRMNFWYDLDYLLNKFVLRREIPEHLIR